MRLKLVLLGSCLLAPACGGGSGPTTPDPPPPPGAVSAVVFYDENGDGTLDPQEVVRIPEVEVTVAGQALRTVGTGRADFDNVPAGSQSVAVSAESLPPFYEAPQPAAISVPRQDPVPIGVTLPIAPNRPNVYLAFGDSITEGFRSEDGRGWVGRLDEMLRDHFGAAEVINDGIPATRTIDAAARIGASLAAHQPAYALVYYGINDYNEPDCRRNPPCYTIDSLRSVVRDVKAAGSLPFLATISPANTGFDFRAPPFRNQLAESQNALIREMAAEEGAVLVDLYEAFLAFGPPNESGLLFDHVHPNDMGYQLIADVFLEAILRGRVPAASRR